MTMEYQWDRFLSISVRKPRWWHLAVYEQRPFHFCFTLTAHLLLELYVIISDRSLYHWLPQILIKMISCHLIVNSRWATLGTNYESVAFKVGSKHILGKFMVFSWRSIYLSTDLQCCGTKLSVLLVERGSILWNCTFSPLLSILKEISWPAFPQLPWQHATLVTTTFQNLHSS